MSRILEVQDKLRENTALIARLEKSLAIRDSQATAASLRSLYKLNHVYQEEFMEVAAVEAVDVISYRLFDGRERPTMTLLGKALEYFQNLYTILYASVVSGKPKDTGHLSAAVISQTAFEFSYTYSGSVGFVFTIPNERLLVGETRLDEAMGDLFSMARSSGTEAIKAFARQFGLAPVRAIYKWADALTDSGVGTEIQWRKNDALKNTIVLQPSELESLRNLIELTSELEIDENNIIGTLLGFDVKSGMFRFDPLDGSAMIKGQVANDADVPAQIHIPQKYSATIKTTTKVRYSTDQPEISHELRSIEIRD